MNSPSPRPEPVRGRTLNCTWLLTALLTLILLLPLAQSGRTGKLLLAILATATLLGGIVAVSTSRPRLLWGCALLIPAIATVWLQLGNLLPPSSWLASSSLYSLPFYIFLALQIWTYIFRSGPVMRDRLVAALCFYLILGLCWAHLYVLVLQHNPQAIQGIGSGEPLPEMVYFSYVTLTTLGYGDISPVSMAARSLSILEAIFGVLFMGALVARLAGAAQLTEASTT